MCHHLLSILKVAGGEGGSRTGDWAVGSGQAKPISNFSPTMGVL